MADQTSHESKTPDLGRLTGFIGLAVIFLAAANGIFTYSGALLYVEEIVYALLFAVAVQVAISTTLLALPYIRGIGKLVLLSVYAAALALSTLSAYTYIYNASRPEAGQGIQSMDTATKTRIADLLGAARQHEQRELDTRRVDLARVQRAMDEEERQGGRSGKGPGRGEEYYRKQEAYQQRQSELAAPERNSAQATPLYHQLEERLAGEVAISDRTVIASLVAQIRALTTSDQAVETLSTITRDELGNLRNPVERAILPLLDPNEYSLTVLVSLVWAAIFDLLALFLGIIRYYLMKPDYSLLNGLYQGVLDFVTFVIRLFNARREAQAKYQREHGMRVHEMPLNSTEMQIFATSLFAGSELSSVVGGDPVEPLRSLVSYIEPLHLESLANSVGIPHQRVDDEPRLKPLMAILMQQGVFQNRPDAACYLLNSSGEMAQRVLVFLRMGMKGQVELPFKSTLFPELPASA